MARKVQVELIDDIDESPAEGTRSFSLDGEDYEIDLSKKNSDKLQETLSDWIKHARKTGGRQKRRPGTANRYVGIDKNQAKKIRQWAKENDIKVNSRGAIKGEVIEAYNRAHGVTTPTKPVAKPATSIGPATTEPSQKTENPAEANKMFSHSEAK